MTEEGKGSTYDIDTVDVVNVVEFSPFELSSNLLAYGTSTRITIGTCKFQEEDPEVDGVEFERLRDFHHGTRITTLAWSPETSLTVVPKLVRFATAGSDKKIRVYTSDLKNEDSTKLLEGHSDYVNSVCFEPEQGDQLASVSDDHTCRVWQIDGTEQVRLPLGAPGMSVCWHIEEPSKILVAEKNGIIRFYNLLGQQPIMSLDCGHSPLLSADWCLTNPMRIGAVAGTDWFIFDTAKSSFPAEHKQAHCDGGKIFRWARSNENLISTTGRPGTQIKVHQGKTTQTVLSSSLQITNGLSWHLRLPFIAAGGDKKLHFWMVEGQ